MSCDCTSEKSERSIDVPNENNLKANTVKSCDCSSEESEAKIYAPHENADRQDNLQTNSVKSCDCTSEEDTETTLKVYEQITVIDDNVQLSASESCDCSSDGNSQRKMKICEQTASDSDDLKPPFAIVQVELSRSMLHLLSSTEPSTSCGRRSSNSEDSESKTTSCSEQEDNKVESCDCTSESSLGSEEIERKKKLECTLAIIKPEAVIFREEIERTIEEEGFSIRQRRWLQLTPEQVADFYRDDYEGKADLARLVAYMSCKPIVVFALSKFDAIREWRLLIGPSKVSEARLYFPDSIRGKFGKIDGDDDDDDTRNAVHGSSDERSAEREIHWFFPDCVLEPTLEDDAAEKYLWRQINETLSRGLVKCCETKAENPVQWLGNWLLDDKRQV